MRDLIIVGAVVAVVVSLLTRSGSDSGVFAPTITDASRTLDIRETFDIDARQEHSWVQSQEGAFVDDTYAQYSGVGAGVDHIDEPDDNGNSSDPVTFGGTDYGLVSEYETAGDSSSSSGGSGSSGGSSSFFGGGTADDDSGASDDREFDFSDSSYNLDPSGRLV